MENMVYPLGCESPGGLFTCSIQGGMTRNLPTLKLNNFWPLEKKGGHEQEMYKIFSNFWFSGSFLCSVCFCCSSFHPEKYHWLTLLPKRYKFKSSVMLLASLISAVNFLDVTPRQIFEEILRQKMWPYGITKVTLEFEEGLRWRWPLRELESGGQQLSIHSDWQRSHSINKPNQN